MFTVKRFKFVSRQTLFNPIEFFAVVFLFSRHARSSSFFSPLAFQLFSPAFLLYFFTTDQRWNRTKNIFRRMTIPKSISIDRPRLTAIMWLDSAWEPLFPDVSDCIMDDYYAHPCKFRQKRLLNVAVTRIARPTRRANKPTDIFRLNNTMR